MASLFFSAKALVFSLFVLLISTADSLTCSSQSLKYNKLYEKCVDLPSLNSHIHYTYNATKFSFSVVLIANQPSFDVWVAWAINPTGTGMEGYQLLFAFRCYGFRKVKTYGINSCSSIPESKLPFDTWDLSAESGEDGAVIIYGSFEVPESAEKLKVRHVGPKVSADHANKHKLSPENIYSKETLTLPPSPALTCTFSHSSYSLRLRKLLSFEKVQPRLVLEDRRIFRPSPPQPSGDPRIHQ